MKKIYILMPNGIVGMGGGQMYTRNKVIFMKRKGWDTIVFSGMTGEVFIEELREYKECIIPELSSSPLIYSLKIQDRILKKIRKIIGTEYSECVIESNTPHMALWGEMLANSLGGRHIIFLLDERLDLIVPIDYLGFYEFKLMRKELAFIHPKSFEMLFRKAKSYEKDQIVTLKALCTNVVEDYNNDIITNIVKSDINIGSIGRLEKPYVSKLVDQFCMFAKRHADLSISYVFVGGADKKRIIEEIEKKLKKHKNVNLYITGYIYPIPIKLFDIIDLFVSSAGSANVSYSMDVPTIALNAITGLPNGILGYTTQKTLFPEDTHSGLSLCEMMEGILFSNWLEGLTYTPKNKVFSDNSFNMHLAFLGEANPENLYYDVVNMLLPSGKDLKKKIIRSIIGTKLYLKLKKYYIAKQ